MTRITDADKKRIRNEVKRAGTGISSWGLYNKLFRKTSVTQRQVANTLKGKDFRVGRKSGNTLYYILSALGLKKYRDETYVEHPMQER